MSKIGMVILNYNDYKTTIEMIEQIKDFKVLDYIIITDNNSPDNSYKKLKKYEKNNIKVINTKDNKGYAAGNNFGVKYLLNNYDVDYVIISNPDILLNEESIKKLKKDLDNNKDISLIAPNISELGNIRRGWQLPKYVDELLSNMNYFHKIAKKRMNYNDSHYNSEFSEVEVVSGCFFIIRKEVIEEVDYFDENTFLYYEENILGKRLKNNGFKSYIDNNVTVTHNLSVSIDKSLNNIKKYKLLKDSQKYYQKEYNNLNIFGMILLRLVYYISLFNAYIIYFVRNIWR